MLSFSYIQHGGTHNFFLTLQSHNHSEDNESLLVPLNQSTCTVLDTKFTEAAAYKYDGCCVQVRCQRHIIYGGSTHHLTDVEYLCTIRTSTQCSTQQ